MNKGLQHSLKVLCDEEKNMCISRLLNLSFENIVLIFFIAIFDFETSGKIKEEPETFMFIKMRRELRELEKYCQSKSQVGK